MKTQGEHDNMIHTDRPAAGIGLFQRNTVPSSNLPILFGGYRIFIIRLISQPMYEMPNIWIFERGMMFKIGIYS